MKKLFPRRYSVDWRKRWVYGPNGGVLHRVAVMPKDWAADGWVPIGGEGIVLCGLEKRWGMPGLFSRLYQARCKRCCRILGIPFGDGCPFNDKVLSEVFPND